MTRELPKRPDVFRYQDHREFLRHFFEYSKAIRPPILRKRVAQELGISVSNLSMILSGKRRLTIDHAIKLGQLIGLSNAELRYFEALVQKGESKDPEAVVHSLSRMGEMRSFKGRNPKEAEVIRYLTHWYYVAIREMAGIPGFQLDPKWIKGKLLHNVPTAEIQKALAFLLEHGYLKAAADGSVSPPEKSIECLDGVFRMALIQFHREMIELASRAIHATPPQKRSILGYTFVGDAKAFAKAAKVIERAQAELRAIAQEETDGDTVFHAELCLFPLTKDE